MVSDEWIEEMDNEAVWREPEEEPEPDEDADIWGG